MTEAKFYKQLKNNQVQCRLCHHFCVIKNNNLGICRARKNKAGKLISLVYGFPVAHNVDPIEKKPLYHFLPGSISYSIGTLGCNFSCANCQNWDISQAGGIEKKNEKNDYLSPERIVEEAMNNDCQSISYTYNEPTVFAEYGLDIMKLARRNGLRNVWVSNGYMSADCLETIFPYLDAANIDLKSMDENFYKENCGAKLKPVLENLVKLKREQIHLEVTTLIIPGLSDDVGMLEKMAKFMAKELDADTPWHVSKFSPQSSWKLKSFTPTGDDIIYSAYEIGKEAGLKYVYVGNMPGDQKENTYCPKCNQLAIRRFGFQIERLDVSGRCSSCDKNLDILE
ncbi:AmmeMemoRadiSam system radical SAM enzyme [Candidatus Falkowbacteria bacterium CG11_big_fil_rev_8_21_14_0_20_39_10]|uniref:AmmeMemoRadiSam system radical SAM enzyme n=1 Tax=Candidatus Falkowbacteria bacterium CG11_big_fil_rev_8_21_14_0_20_39_10 TaxID=1974570 RepID=A0A2M6K9Z0_9BACT|nr:MAG: AmmeMemoRadiSam system radical SAM enzyme [Candidatus Falkowbacteria bacterium CG11_big_fil_rev_8_21_14_0_20_39_10]